MKTTKKILWGIFFALILFFYWKNYGQTEYLVQEKNSVLIMKDVKSSRFEGVGEAKIYLHLGRLFYWRKSYALALAVNFKNQNNYGKALFAKYQGEKISFWGNLNFYNPQMLMRAGKVLYHANNLEAKSGVRAYFKGE